MKKIVIIGFGAMGCRHAQSILNHPETANWWIAAIEPDSANYQLGLQKIGVDEHRVQRLDSIDQLPDDVDLAIVATSAAPRFTIVNQLLDKGIRYYLLEKIIFQSQQQFDHIINRLTEMRASAYGNFVNRYFDNYNHIRKYIQANPGVEVEMTVTGGEFGLGCNAIHYMDLFEYLTASNGQVQLHATLLEELESGNKRGKQYKEFRGALQGSNRHGHSLRITSFPQFESGIVIQIRLGSHVVHQLNENTGAAFEYQKGEIRQHAFQLLPTSKLTATICLDMLKGVCRLSTVQETRNTHLELFRVFNKALKTEHTPETLCPIT